MEDRNEIQQQFIELRAKGNSYNRIAGKLGVSKGTLIEWSKQLSIEVSNLKNIETEALMEKHKMAKSHQMEILGTQLVKIRTELEKRDLSDVSTDKLVTMELKLLDSINTGGTEVKFVSSDFFVDLPEHTWNG